MKIIDRLFGILGYEQRTTAANPSQWLVDWIRGGPDTDAGVQVSYETSLTYHAVYRAVNLISRDVAKIPLFVYKNLSEGGKEREKKHPAYTLLRRRANSEMLAFGFKQTMMAHALLRGNGYAYIWRRGDGAPYELTPLVPDPEITTPVRENNKLFYLTHIDGVPHKLLPQNVLHIKGLGYDGLQGYSVVAKARESFGLGLAAQKYGAVFFKHGARGSGVLMIPGHLKGEAAKQLQESFDKSQAGLTNAHRTILLEEGTKYQQTTIPNEEAQFLQTRDHELRAVANWFSLPPHKLGDTSRTAYNSLESEAQSYLDDTLDGWLVTWEEECRDKLLSDVEKETESHTIEFERAAILRADLAARTQAYSVALQGGWMNRDQVAARENLPPLPDGEGQKYFYPLNLGIVGEEEPEPEPPPFPPPEDDEDDEADTAEGAEGGEEEDQERQKLLAVHRQLLVDTLRRMAKRLGIHAVKESKNARTFTDWLDERMITDHAPVVREALAGPIAAWATIADADANEALELTADMLFGWVKYRLDEAVRVYTASQLAENVKDLAERWTRVAPEAITDSMIDKQQIYKLRKDNQNEPKT